MPYIPLFLANKNNKIHIMNLLLTFHNENLAAPRDLSLMVYELLDKLGLSEEIRKLHREYAYTGELSANLECLGDSFSCYIFGSTIDGQIK